MREFLPRLIKSNSKDYADYLSIRICIYIISVIGTIYINIVIIESIISTSITFITFHFFISAINTFIICTDVNVLIINILFI